MCWMLMSCSLSQQWYLVNVLDHAFRFWHARNLLFGYRVVFALLRCNKANTIYIYPETWAPFQYFPIFLSAGTPVIKMRQSSDRLIFMVGISTSVRWHLHIEMVHWWFNTEQRQRFVTGSWYISSFKNIQYEYINPCHWITPGCLEYVCCWFS